MIQSNTIQDDFSKESFYNSPKINNDDWIIAYDFLSGMMTEAFVILDFDQKKIQSISNSDLILCGYTQEASKELGYDFFKEVIHPEDLPFWEEIHNIIFDSRNSDGWPPEQINYFSFLLRIKRASLSSNRKSDYLMTYVKLKPWWFNEQQRYGICILSTSVIRKPDKQLCAHYKDMGHSSYSFKTKQWKHHHFLTLSKRQKEILVFAQQGLSLKETAEKMNVSNKTIESIRQTLFEKFGVNTIEQAIQYASNRRLIYHPSQIQPISKKRKQPKI